MVINTKQIPNFQMCLAMNFSFEVDVNATDQVRVYLEGNAIVSDKEIVVTLTAQLCHPNTLDCSPSLSVLNQSIFDTLCNPGNTSYGLIGQWFN